MKLILAEPFKSLWAGRDAFAEVERLQGRTLRTEVAGHGFFVKIHRGIGWGEIFKNLLTAKLPVLGAGQEWRAGDSAPAGSWRADDDRRCLW